MDGARRVDRADDRPLRGRRGRWFNFKVAFEAFITVGDEAESKKLQVFGDELQGPENALLIDPRHRNPEARHPRALRVVNVIFTAGDANRGVQTAAFKLPNDERRGEGEGHGSE